MPLPNDAAHSPFQRHSLAIRTAIRNLSGLRPLMQGNHAHGHVYSHGLRQKTLSRAPHFSRECDADYGALLELDRVLPQIPDNNPMRTRVALAVRLHLASACHTEL